MRLTAKFEGSRTSAVRPVRSATKRVSEMPMPVAPAARNLALAHHIERLIDRGLIVDYTHAARMLGVSQPRVTHLMGLVLLAPRIQEAILLGTVAPKDKELRDLARIAEWRSQEDQQAQTRLHDSSLS